jgi:serine/threonine-protein kinase
MGDTLAGLHAAHELCGSNGELLKLVHRDVSPQNILVGADGVSRITDFGVAFAAARTATTQEGRVKGKFSYMAPEQVQGEEATRRMDIFAAGTVLWETLTCRPLFRRKDDVATINAVLGAEVPPPSSVVPNLPPALDDIVLKALHRDPSKRFQTAAEFADALEGLNVEHATSRSVAAHVEDVMGAVLRERRTAIRAASEKAQGDVGFEPAESDARLIRSLPEEPIWADAAAKETAEELIATRVMTNPLGDLAEEPPLDPAEIEHRRIRGLIAAAMLLLVGGALGLLLARSNGAAPAPAQPAVGSTSGATGAPPP